MNCILLLLIVFSNAQIYSNVGVLGYVNPVNLCRGELCRLRVKDVIKQSRKFKVKLEKLDKIERRLNKESTHDIYDMDSLTNRRDQTMMRTKLRIERHTLRKLRITRVRLLSMLRKVLSNLSYDQQQNVIRYVGMEHILHEHDTNTPNLFITSSYGER